MLGRHSGARTKGTGDEMRETVGPGGKDKLVVVGYVLVWARR